jgi:hypothetical protein
MVVQLGDTARWRSPFRVTTVLGHDRYEVTDISGALRCRVKYAGYPELRI